MLNLTFSLKYSYNSVLHSHPAFYILVKVLFFDKGLLHCNLSEIKVSNQYWIRSPLWS